MCKKEDVDMSTKEIVKPTPESQNNHVVNALKEVELIQTGKLSKKPARDFLKESRQR